MDILLQSVVLYVSYKKSWSSRKIEDVERGAELSFRGRFADPPHVRFADPA